MNAALLALAFFGALHANGAALRSGTAETDSGRALAVADGKGGLALIVVSRQDPLSRSIVDMAAARLIGRYGLERASIVFQSPPGSPDGARTAEITDALYTLAAAALGRVDAGDPFRGLDFVLPSAPAGSAQPASGPIRAAYKDIDPPGLRRRDRPPALYPVQAIRIGRGLTILAVGGQPELATLPEGIVVIPNANGSYAAPESAAVITDAVQDVLTRVGVRVR